MNVLKHLLFVVLIPQIISKPEFSCPPLCICDAKNAATRCRGLGLTNLTNTPIHPNTVSLDLSYNKFHGIPGEIQNLLDLQYLYLQYNHIGSVTKTDFENLSNLRAIDLSSNNLANKQSIDARFIIPLINLQVLDLSHNPLYTFPNFKETNSNLQILNAANCSITNIVGNILKGLDNIKSINLSKNPIQYIQHLESKSLTKLNVSDCNIQHISQVDLRGLSALTTLSIARNYHLKSFTSNSSTIVDIDLSDCNLNTVPDVWFSGLTRMNLEGNRITTIPVNAFQGVPNLEMLVLTDNAINVIEADAFNGLTKLLVLDLSFNRINEIKPSTFVQTPQLRKLFISHNYIKRIKWNADSLRYLDVSNCEIMQLAAKDLMNMPILETLVISHNWLSDLPNNLIALNLRSLDVSMCGIWTLTNETLVNLPKLRQLKLQGNRLSSQISKDVFRNITEIYLGDNPWRCDCQNTAFRDLYFWLNEDGRINDHYELLCRSPAIYEGQHWYVACGEDWTEQTNTSQLWIFTITTMLVITIGGCILWHCLRSCAQKKKREDELIRRQEIQDLRQRRERLSRHAVENRQEADRNAPDPRDVVRPPTYDEAILLPLVLSRSLSTTSCTHSTSCAECTLSTSANESTSHKKNAKAKNYRKDSTRSSKRRRRRPRSALLDNTTITSDSSHDPIESTTAPSSITSERGKNSDATTPRTATLAPEDQSE